MPSDTLEVAARVATRFQAAHERHVESKHCRFLRHVDCVTRAEFHALRMVLKTVPPNSGASSDGASSGGAGAATAAAAAAALSELAPQSDMGLPPWGEGETPLPMRNVWIVKPNHLSKGSGIVCLRDAEDVIRYAQSLAYGVVAQKYLERPLLVHRRKMDVRQWVLISELNPLTVWLFKSAYARTSATPFDLDRLDDRFIHLCNHAVQASHPDYVSDSQVSSVARGFVALGCC